LPSNIEVQTHDAIDSLQMGFLPVSGLSNKSGASYLIPQDPGFRLDFLTTLHRGGETPYEHPKLHVTLQPLKFMEFSLVDVQQAVLFSVDGAVTVNIPHPARFTLHKLIIYGERTGAFAAKSNKDLLQAASLLAFYKAHRAWEIEAALEDLKGRGKGWVTRLERGLNALEQKYPELEIKQWLKV
jgi:hypothetical protein